ncbi:ankyrin repeat domain-containing protein [Fadolivirus algeromassiliense]|jgi:ankyrin repeat protein|uniref:Ankyrin repeat domain-containing protein n=1 Tax=Fadolivirus FV1/VV64 TaxID=3070911 RepID=A0A7D3R0D9_9VIRU|nr:ankyrin repeat domain-containing protein [Fadolivirus algeromassiliense]QKF93602.1 ankyrin repeat domain-containing protein [Fadolivirus FV1/VV64]
MTTYIYSIDIIKNNPGYLQEVFNIKSLEENELLFGFLCGEGLLNDAMWILERDKRIDIHSNHEFPFRQACKYNKLDCVLWLYEYSNKINSPINYNIYDDYIFRKFCRNGTLPMVKWLYKNKNINISAKDDAGFRKACEYGHLDVIRWILKHHPDIDITARENYAMKHICMNGHFEVLKYLLGKFKKFNIHFSDNVLFDLACENGRLEIAQYLYYYDNRHIDLTKFIHYPFRMACINNHINIATWLKTLNKKYDFTIVENKITKFVYT